MSSATLAFAAPGLAKARPGKQKTVFDASAVCPERSQAHVRRRDGVWCGHVGRRGPVARSVRPTISRSDVPVVGVRPMGLTPAAHNSYIHHLSTSFGATLSPRVGRGRNLVASSIRTATGRFMSALKFRGIERASGAPVMSEPGSRGADAWIRIELTERRNPHAETSGGSREIFSRGRSGVTVSKKTRSALLSATSRCRVPRWMARQERKHPQISGGAAQATSPEA